MDYGMPNLIENETLEQDISLCKKLGLNFIELNTNFPEYQIEKLEDTYRLISLAEEAGIYYTIHIDENLNVADFNPIVRAAYLETVSRTIEVARALAPLKKKYYTSDSYAKLPMTINMHMNHGIVVTLPEKKVLVYEKRFEEYMENFRRFRELVEEWIKEDEIQIAIENTDGFRDFEKKAIEYLLQSDKFVLTWDIGHSKATDEYDEPFIRKNKDKLKHFHIHDGMTNPPKNHLALGTGKIDLFNRLQLARDCNARCVLETKTITALEHSCDWLDEHNLR